MTRIALAALLALTAFVVPPAHITPTTLPIHSEASLGSDSDTQRIGIEPVHLNATDGDEIRVDEPDDWSGLISGRFALHLAPRTDGDAGPSEASPPRSARLQNSEGATPPISVPARRSVTPISHRTIIAALTPLAWPESREPPPEPQQIYAGLIKPEKRAQEQRCLAEAVYFEARSEGEDGQAAVAQVVLNRVMSGRYPDTVCGVVYQNRHRKLACQFTFACEGKSLRITEPEPWQLAERIAREVYEGKIYLEDVGASTHYHADYVHPHWAKKLKKMDVIGRHIFYRYG
ncbi:cell wall hydrolase [Bosea sp. Root381]|uniref:cell wall hydrolase n=1 Tax=Bosea sp. Root381 TaxID=1736524 RepID=UPI0009EA3CDA|nr:cell wall hydrolase [Bosea sp. Root381]